MSGWLRDSNTTCGAKDLTKAEPINIRPLTDEAAEKFRKAVDNIKKAHSS